MKNVVEKQLSWFALIMTAFYSLLASCRAEDCGHEHLARCAGPLGKITNNNELGFVTTKEELEALCPQLEDGMTCIKKYTLTCMEGEQRENFNSLYNGVNMAIMELCQDSPYQDEFLKHAPCMQKVQAEYEICSKRYVQAAFAIERRNQTSVKANEPLKGICCAFQEYLDCSHNTVLRKCGKETAEFTKDFLDKMSNSLMKMHCEPYTHGECDLGSGSESVRVQTVLIPLALVYLARYFT
ncbi:uncharacterized protein [Venturia canescens]|uniref:uncharacterized protein n=1 Tax=Venturia canescens TaxID=32260 RepID=UPI001C9C84FC|nr:uncharacterized protein LOC122419486 [Venturia canescens]